MCIAACVEGGLEYKQNLNSCRCTHPAESVQTSIIWVMPEPEPPGPPCWAARSFLFVCLLQEKEGQWKASWISVVLGTHGSVNWECWSVHRCWVSTFWKLVSEAGRPVQAFFFCFPSLSWWRQMRKQFKLGWRSCNIYRGSEKRTGEKNQMPTFGKLKFEHVWDWAYLTK